MVLASDTCGIEINILSGWSRSVLFPACMGCIVLLHQHEFLDDKQQPQSFHIDIVLLLSEDECIYWLFIIQSSMFMYTMCLIYSQNDMYYSIGHKKWCRLLTGIRSLCLYHPIRVGVVHWTSALFNHGLYMLDMSRLTRIMYPSITKLPNYSRALWMICNKIWTIYIHEWMVIPVTWW